MRKIKYILIHETPANQPHRDRLPLFGYHFCVNRPSSECNPSSLGDCRVAREVGKANSEVLVVPLVDIRQPVSLVDGPIYDPDKFNRSSIAIRYCGSLRPESWLLTPETRNLKLETGVAMKPETSCKGMLQQRQALLDLLVSLRSHFPDAKILGLSGLNPKECHARNIIVSDTMNLLRRELSDYP